MLLLVYESEISVGFLSWSSRQRSRSFSNYDREVSRLRLRSFSITIEKFLDYDWEVSRLRSRSVSITIEKFLDYDREDSRLRSRRFSTTIEKILDYDREDSWKVLPKSSRQQLSRSFSIEKVIDEALIHSSFTLFLFSIGLTYCCYYMPLSFTTLRKWREKSPQNGLPQGLNSHPIAGLRPLALLQVPPPNQRIPHDRVSTLCLYCCRVACRHNLVPEFYYQS